VKKNTHKFSVYVRGQKLLGSTRNRSNEFLIGNKSELHQVQRTKQ